MRKHLTVRSSAVIMVTAAATLAAPTSGGGPIPCTEEAVERGIDYPVSLAALVWGRGVAFVDLDQDGDADVVAVGRAGGGRVGLFENDGTGLFDDRSTGSGIPLLPDASGVVAGDYDGDGDLDLYVSGWAADNTLLRNDGGFQFADVSVAAGVDDDGPGVGCAWGDYDGDGWLDLYVANRTGDAFLDNVNKLYRNLGDGTFEEVGETLGVDDGDSPSFQGVFLDFDRDGDPDIYVTTDKGYALGEENRLYENVGGTFVDITDASGTAAQVEAMGVAVGDLDHNGYPDLYITNTTPGNVFFTNQGDGTFLDESVESGMGCFQGGWGTLFFDHDNDGFMEVYAVNSQAPNCFYDPDGVWPTDDTAAEVGLAGDHVSYGLAAADIDADGDLDVLVGDADRVRLYINHEGERRRWARFRVRGLAPNVFSVGAGVDTLAGGTWRLREVTAGGNYKSQNEMPLHVGLDDAIVIDQVVVTWPHVGTGGFTRVLTDLPTDQTWTLYHPTLLFDTDQDGDIGLDDAAGHIGCRGPIEPGCEMMDGDGDADIDDDDFAMLMAAYEDPILDCDGSGTGDLEEIVAGVLPDANVNGLPDGCEQAGDVNGDGAVNVSDILEVILGWGPCPDGPCYGDADLDGEVAVLDLVAVIGGWTG